MLKRLLKRKHTKKLQEEKQNNVIESDMNDANGLTYYKFIQLLELSAALETILSSSWAKSATTNVNVASIELAKAIGFGSNCQSFGSNYPIIEQLLRITTTIALDYYDLGDNFSNIEECILSSLAISIFLLVTDNATSFSFLYDLYLLPDANTLSMHDIRVLLHDTISKTNNKSNCIGKGARIKIDEVSTDMIHFKKARESALLTPLLTLASTSSETSSEISSSSLPLDECFLKIKFNKYIALKHPPINQYLYLIDRFQIAIWGKNSWAIVKKMNVDNKVSNDDSFITVHTKLLSDFSTFMKKIEARMKSMK